MKEYLFGIIESFRQFIQSKVFMGKICPVWLGNVIPDLAWNRVKGQPLSWLLTTVCHMHDFYELCPVSSWHNDTIIIYNDQG